MPDHAFDITPQSFPTAAALGRLCLCVHAHRALLSSSGNMKWLTELTGLWVPKNTFNQGTGQKTEIWSAIAWGTRKTFKAKWHGANCCQAYVYDDCHMLLLCFICHLKLISQTYRERHAHCSRARGFLLHFPQCAGLLGGSVLEQCAFPSLVSKEEYVFSLCKTAHDTEAAVWKGQPSSSYLGSVQLKKSVEPCD